jgi:hypothetical protein
MRANDWTWAYWGVFALGLVTGAALIGVVFWRVQQAYASSELSRAVLTDALLLGLAALMMLLVSGWAFANRPSRIQDDERTVLWD